MTSMSTRPFTISWWILGIQLVSICRLHICELFCVHFIHTYYKYLCKSTWRSTDQLNPPPLPPALPASFLARHYSQYLILSVRVSYYIQKCIGGFTNVIELHQHSCLVLAFSLRSESALLSNRSTVEQVIVGDIDESSCGWRGSHQCK